MSFKNIKIVGEDLASRTTASAYRVEALTALEAGSKGVLFDLSSVKSLSESFADELFGVLVSSRGLNWFVKTVTIQSAERAVILSIASALRGRLVEREGPALNEQLKRLAPAKKSRGTSVQA